MVYKGAQMGQMQEEYVHISLKNQYCFSFSRLKTPNVNNLQLYYMKTLIVLLKTRICLLQITTVTILIMNRSNYKENLQEETNLQRINDKTTGTKPKTRESKSDIESRWRNIIKKSGNKGSAYTNTSPQEQWNHPAKTVKRSVQMSLRRYNENQYLKFSDIIKKRDYVSKYVVIKAISERKTTDPSKGWWDT